MTTSDIHDQALNWFVRVGDADAPEGAWLEFQTWLEANPARGEAYGRIEQIWVALEAHAPAEAVVAPIAANDVKPARGRFSRAWLTPLLATAAAAVMVVGFWPEISGEGRFRTYSTDGAPREVVLSDGSRLSMNRHSDLRVRIGARDREVAIAGGEVAFDVTHDPARPFLIAAEAHEIRVLGTVFNVLSHDGRFSVGVRRGLVAGTQCLKLSSWAWASSWSRTGRRPPSCPESILARRPPGMRACWSIAKLIWARSERICRVISTSRLVYQSPPGRSGSPARFVSATRLRC